MLINFALECMGSEIRSDKVSTDGYEACNLLRSDWRKSGFMAERFIKPPVTITLRLPCPVNLYCIILDPQVGSQKSSRLEIYTAFLTRNYYRTKLSTSREELGIAQKRLSCNGEPQNSKEEPLFLRTGSISCLQHGPVCCLNPRFYAEHTITTEDDAGPNLSSIPNRIELHHHQWQALNAAQYVAVRVTGTVNGSVVALGRLEVWGCPARSCPAHIRENMWQRYSEAQLDIGQGMIATKKATKRIDKSSCSTTHAVTGSYLINSLLNDSAAAASGYENCAKSTKTDIFSNTDSACDQLEIPEEYLDALTCEIMMVPMLLPSGQNVDLSTLERFEDVEATYGRRASDPFTGLTFTATRRPVLNSVLKIRIDSFLSRNAGHPSLAQVPRVLGHGAPCGVAHFSHNMDPEDRHPFPRKRKDEHSDCCTCTVCQPVHKSDLLHCNAVAGGAKKFRLDNSEIRSESRTASFTIMTDARTSSDISSKKKPDKAEVSSIAALQSHADRLSSSLSVSLTSVLQGLPSFVSEKNDGDHASSKFQSCTYSGKCVGCKQNLTKEGSVAYLLTCSHHVCRRCLTQLMKSMFVFCPLCSHQCSKADVVRSHVQLS